MKIQKRRIKTKYLRIIDENYREIIVRKKKIRKKKNKLRKKYHQGNLI